MRWLQKTDGQFILEGDCVVRKQQFWRGNVLKVAKILFKSTSYIEGGMFLWYYRTEKCIKLQKSFARRLYERDSQRFLFR